MDTTSNDPVATFDNEDLSNLEAATGSLLDQTHEYLKFPIPAVGSSGSASSSLNYRFQARVQASLDGSWTLFDGLTLTNVSLETQVSKAKDDPAQLFVQLSASAVLGECNFRVKGTIPSLGQKSPVDFTLLLEVGNSKITLDPGPVVQSLTQDAHLFSSAVTQLDPGVSSQIEQGDASGVSFAASALLTVTRQIDGTLFLKSIEIGFVGNLHWAVIRDHVELSEVALSLRLGRDLPNDPWKSTFSLAGSVAIDNLTTLLVSGTLRAGDETSLSLAVTGQGWSGLAPEDVLNRFIGTDTEIDKKLHLPPSLPTIDKGFDPFNANFEFRKHGTDWYIARADATLLWQLMYWNPPIETDLLLQSLFLQYFCERSQPLPGQSPSEALLSYEATLGGRLLLDGMLLAAVLTYDGKNITIACSIEDQELCSLEDIAWDPQLNPPKATGSHDLLEYSKKFPSPDPVPIEMSLCTSRVLGKDRKCILTLTDSTLKRVQLSAAFQVDWQITPLVSITNLGVYIDILNPVSKAQDTIIQGYIYGNIVLASKVNLFAFIAGVSSPSSTQFLVALSVSFDPTSGVGTSPQTIFGDSQLMGSPVPKDNWKLPESLPPGATVDAAVEGTTSLSAKMALSILQSPGAEAETYNTKIAAVRASLDIHSDWEVFSGVKLRQFSMTVVAVPADASSNKVASYYAELAGMVDSSMSTVDNTTYELIVAARVRRDEDAKLQFSATISAYRAGEVSNMSLSTLFQTPLIGLGKADVLGSANTVPSALPVQPAALMSGPLAECSLWMKKDQDVWELDRIEASISQQTPWTIVEGKLVVTNSSLKLEVQHPRKDDRKIRFFATTLLQIGTLVGVSASILATRTGAKDDSLTLVIQSGNNLQQMVTQLVGAPIDIPNQCPVLSGNYTFTLTVTCKSAQNSTGFEIEKVLASVTAVPSTAWELGPLAVTALRLDVLLEKDEHGAFTTKGAFQGNATMSGESVQLRIEYSPATLTVTVQDSIASTKAVSTFVSGGLSSNSFSSPSFSQDTGLSDYQTRATKGIEVVFKYNKSWYADSMTLIVVEQQKTWTLVDPVLVANGLSLRLSLTGLSSSKKELQAILTLNFQYKHRPPLTDFGNLPCKLTATQKELETKVDTRGCTIPNFLYVATAGFWNPPDFLDFPAITPDSLTLRINWEDGNGELTATCPDWDLVKSLPKLASMKAPSLHVNLERSGKGLTAKGQLAGVAVLAGVNIPISYDLATGPFKLYGIDVKKAYELTKRLYEDVRDAKAVAEVVAEMAEFEGYMAAAEGCVDGLVAVGIPLAVARTIIDNAFGSSGGGSGGGGGIPSISGGPARGQDDPSSNWNGNTVTAPGQPHLVVSGKLLSPGPAGEDVSIAVYPKNNSGGVLMTDPTRLFLATLNADQSWTDMSVIWTNTTNGYLASLKRPANDCTMEVQYRGEPALQSRFTSKIQAEASVFSMSKSILKCPFSIACGTQGEIVFWPRDQYGQPRYGAQAAPPLKISIVRTWGRREPSYDATKGFTVRNDCLVLLFTLHEVGSYCVRVNQADNPDPWSGKSPYYIQGEAVSDLDNLTEASSITYFDLANPAGPWTTNPHQSWVIHRTWSDVTQLYIPAGNEADSKEKLDFELTLAAADQWFAHGFILSFDVQILSGSSLIIRPPQFISNADLRMEWNNTSNGGPPRGISQWISETSEGSPDDRRITITPIQFDHEDQLIMGSAEPSTICFCYTVTSGNQYSFTAFQAGQPTPTISWNKSDDPPNRPKVGFSVDRRYAVETTVLISNVKRIPFFFNSKPGKESASEIAMSEAWASNYIEPATGSIKFKADGLVADGSDPNNAAYALLTQQPVPKYGCSIAVYSLTVSKAYDFNGRSSHPDPNLGLGIAGIEFGSAYANINSGQWVYWSITKQPSTMDIGPSYINPNTSEKYTVVVVWGQGLVTVFCNGQIAYTTSHRFGDPLVGLETPRMFSWWTDIVWHRLRVTPPLVKER